jgi:membrane-associated phospholipid phosphatase
MLRRMGLPVIALALTILAGGSRPIFAQAPSGEGPQVGKWKTWVLSSPSEIAVPAPPADDSDQTKAELAELRALQALRSPLLDRVVQTWNSAAAPLPWSDLTRRQTAPNPVRAIRAHAYVDVAMADAVVAAYQAKYTYNRKAPHLLAPDLRPAVSMVEEPSYPSEHAAVAGAAAGVLSYLYPDQAQNFAALAREAAFSRLLAGTNYRSDVEAGLALGQAVAQKVIARAQADGSDASYTGTPPTGPGLWVGTNPVEPMAGTWKTWILASNSQLRPGPPPAFGSPEFLAEVAEVKQLCATPTASERAIALFWGAQAIGPFLEAANLLAARDRLSTPRAARMLGLLGAAVMDASVTEWEAKYHYWRLRPFQADPTIVTLIPTPNHPSYPSGLSGVAGVTTGVLTHFFPQEAGRLRYMAEEAAASRLYAGIHYRSDSEAGLQLGRRMAELAIQRDQMNDN